MTPRPAHRRGAGARLPRRSGGAGIVAARLFLAVVALAFATGELRAQSQATTGVIEGLVADETGAALPGVAVVLRNRATNFEKALVTDDRGRFRGVLLPLGPYTVTASLAGFATLVREGIDLALGQTVALEITMQLSAVGEEIVVTGEAALIESSRTFSQVRIDDRSIEGLPNNGRNFLEFSKLTPGVTIVQGPDGEELSISGQKGINNNISVDGADFNNPFFGEQRGGQRPPFTFNIDAVKEVLVVTDGAPPEFGRSSGGFVNVVTKSGTNLVGGTAHVFLRNDDLSARPENPDGTKEPQFDSETVQAGFTLGGPVRSDRLFYFLAYDLQQGESTKQTDPDRIEQRVVDLLAAFGSPGENGPITRTDDADVALAKFDFVASDADLVTLRGTYTFSEQENGTFDVDSWGVSANAVEKDYSQSYTASWVSTLSNSLVNELRLQYAKEWRPRPYNGPDITGQDRPLPDTAVDFARSYRFGMPFFIPVEYDDDRRQINENVSILKGDHSLKGGVEYNDVASAQTFVGFANGRFIFTSTEGFLNYVENPRYVECSDGSTSQNGDCPPGTIAVGPVDTYLQQAGVGDISVEEAGTQVIEQREPAVFIQDKWQPHANWTFEYGLRWEALIMPDPITPADEVFFAPFIGTTVTNEVGTFEFPSDGKIPSDYDMWQPRLAVAWNPEADAQTVVRATAGVYHARVPALSIASSRSTNGSRGQTLFRNSELGEAGVLPPPPAWPDLIPQSEVGDPFRPDVFVFDKDFQTPRTFSYSTSWEREVLPNYALLVKLNYAKTDHITRFINRNDPVFGSPWSTGLPPDGINGITTLTTVESTAKSRYWGATVGVNKRYSDGFLFQAYYTYGEDKSDDDNERDPFSFRYARADDLEPEYSWSDRDQRHRFNGWVLWSAPWGIDVNARYSYRSAQPQSITATGEIAALPQDRINPDGSVTRRNWGRKDNTFKTLDLRLTKDFAVADVTLQPIVDLFNVLGSENFLRPEVTNLIFNFDGTVRSGAGEPRRVQVGLRVLF